MTDISEVLEKIRQLNRLAQSSNIHEASTAAGIAARLISKHRISEEQLRESGVGEDEKPSEDETILYETQRAIFWKESLCGLLAGHFGCHVWNDCVWGKHEAGQWRRGNRTSRFRLVGRKSDREAVSFMFAWLVLEIERLTKLNCKGAGHVASQSFSEGAVSGIKEQLQKIAAEVKVEAAKEGTTAALVRLDARLEESKVALSNLHPDLNFGTKKSFRRVDPGAFQSGQKAGRNIHLGKSMAGKKTKLLGS